MYQTKLFYGNFNVTINGKPELADLKFNEWMKNNPDIEIIRLDYKHTTNGDHSILLIFDKGDI